MRSPRSRVRSSALQQYCAQMLPMSFRIVESTSNLMILGDNLYDAMRYTPCKRRSSLLGCQHVTSSPRSTPIAGCMKGLVVCTPSMPRPTGRAILAGPCSEARGDCRRLWFHDAEFAARGARRAADSADQRSGSLRHWRTGWPRSWDRSPRRSCWTRQRWRPASSSSERE